MYQLLFEFVFGSGDLASSLDCRFGLDLDGYWVFSLPFEYELLELAVNKLSIPDFGCILRAYLSTPLTILKEVSEELVSNQVIHLAHLQHYPQILNLDSPIYCIYPLLFI